MIYLQFGLYLVLMLGIGYYSMRKTHDNQDFIIGGRSLGPVTSAVSAGASDMSGWLLLGLPGAVFASGLVEGVWIGFGLTMGAYLNWLIVAPRLRIATEASDTVTLPSFLSKRFEDNSGLIKTVSTLVILFFFTLYVASGLKGGTLLFAHSFGATEEVALYVTAFVVISYTFLGGYMAVCWTDLIQGILMLAALFFCMLLGYMAISDSSVVITDVRPEAFKFSTSFITGASLVAWGLGYFGQPHILARFIGIDKVENIGKARRIGITWMVLTLILSVSIGLIGIGYDAAHPLATVTGEGGNSERIFLALTDALFHPVFAGFILAAVLAAVMSTADSQLLVLTSSLTEDIGFISKMDEKKKEWISRMGVVGFAVFALIIAANDDGSILAMVGYAWGGFGAAFGPLMILSLCWKGTTKAGAVTGMIVGAVSIFVVKNYISIEGEYFYELLPAFILSFISIIAVSKMTTAPSEETLEKLKI
ncbi:sodium:proline symporter [Vibrio inusitatus NBRC 102082]|uniref:Sodium/proline symporter n=1 Tax=Vibrio inusitatus NBRC 102082 TaxID=1219070 RepID=A0A4Y3I220_9VIBR|nr:sodium/proline symporter PutP [Vibrio inusitatus]GEA52990.1 sodium:proline symporter [Vibrio inusitatus NBRC 102082]